MRQRGGGVSTRDEEEERERRHLHRKASSEKTRLGEREGKICLIVHRHSNHRNMNSFERVGLSLSLSGQVFPVKFFELGLAYSLLLRSRAIRDFSARVGFERK